MNEANQDYLNMTDEEAKALLNTATSLDGVSESETDEEDTVDEPVESNAEAEEAAAVEEAAEAEPSEEEAEVGEDAVRAFYDKLTSEFKAAGKTYQTSDADKLLTWIQQGIAYSKRMEELKPVRQIVKLLEENGIKDRDELNYLLDLKAGKPEAVRKLLDETNLSEYDLPEDAKEYVPEQRDANYDFSLDDTLVEMSASEGGKRTLELVQGFDMQSQSYLVQNPKELLFLQRHVEEGIYDEVMAQVEQYQRQGQLEGLGHLDAYMRVASHMQQNNMFKAQQQAKVQPLASITAKPQAQAKASAVSTKAKPTTGNSSIEEVANMTHDEIRAFLNGQKHF